MNGSPLPQSIWHIKHINTMKGLDMKSIDKQVKEGFESGATITMNGVEINSWEDYHRMVEEISVRLKTSEYDDMRSSMLRIFKEKGKTPSQLLEENEKLRAIAKSFVGVMDAKPHGQVCISDLEAIAYEARAIFQGR